MGFSAKIILSNYVNESGQRAVYLRVIIDRSRVRVPLGFYLSGSDFDARRQRVKPAHRNAKDFDTEFLMAIAKANTIASKFRQEGLLLTTDAFKKEYTDPTEKMDLIKFMEKQLELRRPSIRNNTHKQHQTVINKLRQHKKVILFNQIDRELIQTFRNKLIGDGNGNSTIEKVIKILKQYLADARRNGIAVRDIDIKIKSFRSNRNALTEEEVERLDAYYQKKDTPPHHKKVLQYFLFSCYTGLRISDIKVITWQNIDNDILTYIPVKTTSKQEQIQVPLIEIDKKYLPPYTHDKELVFKTYSDQVNNRHLKDIAKAVGIKKNVTYHTSRHTLASLLAEDGDVIAIQKILGHGNIRTSMEYIHTDIKQLIAAKRERFAK